jgi:hypothetical protein
LIEWRKFRHRRKRSALTKIKLVIDERLERGIALASAALHRGVGAVLAGAGTALAKAGSNLRETGQHLHKRVACL